MQIKDRPEFRRKDTVLTMEAGAMVATAPRPAGCRIITIARRTPPARNARIQWLGHPASAKGTKCLARSAGRLHVENPALLVEIGSNPLNQILAVTCIVAMNSRSAQCRYWSIPKWQRGKISRMRLYRIMGPKR